jgi:hypothetical protein
MIGKADRSLHNYLPITRLSATALSATRPYTKEQSNRIRGKGRKIGNRTQPIPDEKLWSEGEIRVVAGVNAIIACCL